LLIETVTVMGLVAGSFAATNIDNLALLVGWLLPDNAQPRLILAGYLIGMLAVLVTAFAFGYGGAFIPERYVGYLGVVPIALGVKGIYELLRSNGETHITAAPRAGFALVLSIALTGVANGVDTVLVFGPLLADSDSAVDFSMVGGFIVMILVWFWLARFLEVRASRIEIIERYGHWISPIVLIVVGFYILDNTATDMVPGQ
jgi:cadmium resistance protein CadD (predicted permease)